MRSTSLTHQRAKILRRALTPPELVLWTRLRSRRTGGPTFRRQHPFGPYILDFYCSEARLAVEIDGQGHDFGDQPSRDERRDAFLIRAGIQVMRYRAIDVMRDPDGVAQAIFDAAVG